MSEPDIEQLKIALHGKIRLGEQLLVRLSQLDRIEGISKLHKKVKQEINFLQKVRDLLFRFLSKILTKYKSKLTLPLLFIPDNCQNAKERALNVH
jgi:hypothetical protein